MATLSEALATAIQHHQGGRLQAAEQIYRQILQVQPDHADALHLLGVLAHQAGQHRIAAEYIARAIALRPTAAPFHSNLGLCYQAERDLDQAIACWRRAVELQPDFAEAYNNLGNALRERGKTDEAVTACRRAVEHRPDFAEAQHSLGAALRQQGRLDEAAACYRRAVELKPGYAEAYQNLGNICHAQGKLDEAAACYRQAMQIRPNYAEAHNGLGNALQAQGKLEEAIACYRRALELKPDLAAAHQNLGQALEAQGQREAAVACYRRAATFQPDLVEAHTHLAQTLLEQGETDEALAAFDRAVALRPDPATRYHRAICLPVIYRSVEHIRDARQRLLGNLEALRREGVRFDPRRDVLNPLFLLAYQGFDDRPVHEAAARLWSPGPQLCPAGSRARAGGKIRIGFLSSYFRNHTVGDLWRGLIAQLSRKNFAVSVFGTGAADDPVAAFIRQHADSYCQLPADLPAAAQAVAEAQLDILYYPDIGMDPFTYSLAQWRLAPVQCTSWGQPVTSGLATIDYYLSSELLDAADADAQYTEKLVRLKTLGMYVHRWPFPLPRKERAAFGLPDDAHLYACLQNLFKFHPAFDALLAEILRRDPRGMLLVPQAAAPSWDRLLQQRWQATIPDVLARVRWVPRQVYGDYVRLAVLVDALLVPPVFGGGGTSYEAFAFGLPVVTLPSPHLRGRITSGLYQAMGVLDCMAATPEEYVQIAVRLGTDAPWRRAVSERLLAASGRLFEDREAVREVEAFFEWAVSQLG